MSLAPTHGMYALASSLTGSDAASPREAQDSALRAAQGRLCHNGYMFTGNLVCHRCGEVVSEGWMARHMANAHPERANAPYEYHEQEEETP